MTDILPDPQPRCPMPIYYMIKAYGETWTHLNAQQFNRAAELCDLRGVEFSAHYVNTFTREHRVVNR